MIRPITLEDQGLFERFFNDEFDRNNYGNNWAYIMQACRGSGGLGHKYYDGKNLIGVGRHNSHYVLVRPLGKDIVPTVQRLARQLSSDSQRPVYVKHLLSGDSEKLLSEGFKDMREYPWDPRWPKDDDTHPQVILTLSDLFDGGVQGLGRRGIRQSLERFVRSLSAGQLDSYYLDSYDPTVKTGQDKQVISFIREWAKGSDELVQPYANISSHPPNKGYSYVMHLDGQIVGFYVFGIIGVDSVGFHTGISRHWKDHPSLAEANWYRVFEEIFQRGVREVNLGGSEEISLHKFKLKFRPHRLNEAHHLVYIP